MSFLTLIDAYVNETFLLMDISFNLGIERLKVEHKVVGRQVRLLLLTPDKGSKPIQDWHVELPRLLKAEVDLIPNSCVEVSLTVCRVDEGHDSVRKHVLSCAVFSPSEGIRPVFRHELALEVQLLHCLSPFFGSVADAVVRIVEGRQVVSFVNDLCIFT